MKRTFQQKLIFSFLVIFVLFTAGIVIFEQQHVKRYKTDALVEKLDAYAGVVAERIHLSHGFADMDSLLTLMPDPIRLTLIMPDGRVVYDNAVKDVSQLENHANRPEVVEAHAQGTGMFIRTSGSTHLPYLYYAKDYGNIMVRVALLYDVSVQNLLKSDRGFLWFSLGMLAIGLGFIYYIGSRFGRSVRRLRDFSLAVNSDSAVLPHFPKDELGEISTQLVHDLNRIRESEANLAAEREKLWQHVQSSAEGICFFRSDRSVAFYNGLFLQYLNSLGAGAGTGLAGILDEELFEPVRDFLQNRGNDTCFEIPVSRRDREFLLRVNLFEDGSFEVVLNDISGREKTRRLKKEMTGNIAHELRTPVTSIRGFLETVLNNKLDGAKQRQFLERAYAQTCNLSELIADMSLLTKIEEGGGLFDAGGVRIAEVVGKVFADTGDAMRENGITAEVEIPHDLMVQGNANLLYSVFRNLTDNVIRHAGAHVRILVRAEKERDGCVCFSFADTGSGVRDEDRLNRIFERFYRLNEGRTRETGGSGLGLAIVRNAIVLHGGNINVKNRDGGGLEFIFTLPAGKMK